MHLLLRTLSAIRAQSSAIGDIRGLWGPFVKGISRSSRGGTCQVTLLANSPTSIRNEKSAQRGGVRPDVPADIRPKTSVRPSRSCKTSIFGTDMPRTTRRPQKRFRSEKLPADFSFPTSVHQNRAILCGCGGDFRLPLPKTRAMKLLGPKTRDFLAIKNR